MTDNKVDYNDSYVKLITEEITKYETTNTKIYTINIPYGTIDMLKKKGYTCLPLFDSKNRYPCLCKNIYEEMFNLVDIPHINIIILCDTFGDLKLYNFIEELSHHLMIDSFIGDSINNTITHIKDELI